MSSPSSVSGNNVPVGIREGTRVILREITANLQNSPPGTSPRRKSGNEASSIKTDQQHDIKVRFIREFADANDTTVRNDVPPETSSLSSASSFQSLASTLSSKCSSGICVDSSPSNNADRSYLCADISGLDDLITACENICLNDESLNDLTKERSFVLSPEADDHSPDQTFASATDQTSLDLTREDLTVNSPNEKNLDVTRDLSIQNLPINPENEVDFNITRDLSIQNLPINRENEVDLNITRDLSSQNSPINRENDVDHSVTRDSPIQSFPINCPTEVDLNVTRDTSFQNLPINPQTEVELNVTRDSLIQNLPINRPNEVELNVNRDSSIKNLPINPQTEVELDITRDSSIQNLPINHPNEIDLRITKDLSIQNLPINSPTGDDFNITRDLSIEYSTINDPRKADLDVTRDLSIQNSPIKPENNIDLDLTRDLTPDNSLTNCGKDLDSDLDLTKDLLRQKLPINCPNEVDLDLTKDLSREHFLENSGFADPEETRTINGETEASLANADFKCQTVSIVEAKRQNCEFANNSETFVTCVDDQRFVDFVGSEESLKKDELAESVNSALTSKLSISEDEPRGLRGNENPPLELIPPSLSDFQENFGSPKIEKNFEEPEKSPPVALASPTNLINDTISKSINGIPENTQFPSLPSLSSVSLSTHLNETENLPILSNEPIVENLFGDSTQTSSEPISDEQISETPRIAPSPSEKFAAITGNEFYPIDALSTIQEPTFLYDQNFVENSIETKNDNLEKLQDSLKIEGDNLAEIANSQVLKINEDIAKKSISRESQDEISEVEKLNLSIKKAKEESTGEFVPKKEETIELKQEVEVEIEKEIFYDSSDKREENSSSESGDLNATLTLNDISLNADDILAVAESDQFAEFVPQKQSTALVPLHQQKLEICKSQLVAGASSDATFISRPINLPDDYVDFVPQRQSTNLQNFVAPIPTKIQREATPFVTAQPSSGQSLFNGEDLRTSPKQPEIIDDRCNFAKLEAAANSVANDIFNTSLELAEDNDRFHSAKSELFHDPTNFDFLLSKTPRKNTKRDLRAESLYINFDPLVSNLSMLPQGNIQNASPPVNEARNGENNTSMANIGTPKRNPAIAAIDRLLFYSPMSTNVTPTNTNTTIQKTNDTQEKMKSTEETSADTVNMAKELELVRTTVLQLEEQLEKLKIDHEEALEKQTSYKDKINQLQAQLAQETKNKNEITVVVDEYEISISRLVAERERDRKNLDLEKAKLQEELAAAKHHLDNTEAAFNDVHLKYERLKAVVAAYKSNEVALKESIQENVEIIKSLENRYEQVKSHATARLEKANQDLEAIRKQNDSETVRLHAMLRKAELKSNSLAELVEQKTKENKELTQILDEVIARVGRDKSE